MQDKEVHYDKHRLKCIETYSVFATKVLYNDASESGATAHTRTPILVTPAGNKMNVTVKVSTEKI